MISYPIAAARQSGCFDHVVVSTDDDEIAAIAAAEGAEVPFRRPAHLADDHAATAPVVAHAIDACAERWGAVSDACCIYPGTPMLTAEDLARASELLGAPEVTLVFAACAYPHPVQRALRQLPSGGVARVHPEHAGTRTQDLEELLHDAGQFYWGTVDAWRVEGDLLGETSRPHVMQRYRALDIDSLEDWRFAELIMHANETHGPMEDPEPCDR